MRVWHQGLGFGTVIQSRWNNMYYRVKFDNGMIVWVRSNALEIIEKEAEEKKIEIKVKPTRKFDFSSRKMIEAFKLGIVPYFMTKNFTFGREKEIEIINNAFIEYEKNCGNILAIEGEYGSGKTHLLDYIYLMGIEKGFAVSRVEFDPFDVRPTSPKHTYREIVSYLKFNKNGKEINFEEILYEIKNEKIEKRHIFLSPAIEVMDKDEIVNSIVINWIKGEPIPRNYLDYEKYYKLPVLLDHIPAIDIYIYLLTGLAYNLRKIGAKGLLILCDEVETLFRLWWLQEFGFQFYRGLLYSALNDERLTKIGKLKKNWLGKFDENGFLHSGIRPVPYLYNLPSYLFIIFAFTPSSSYYYYKLRDIFTEKRIVELQTLTEKDKRKIYDEIVRIYSNCYENFKLNDAKIFDELKNIKEVRKFIRSTVDKLEIIRHYGK